MPESFVSIESNQAFKRAINRGVILDALRAGPLSRLGLHRQTGIRLTTVGDLADEMLAAGLLVEGGPVARGERGRPEQLLALNLGGPFAVGVYLDGARLRAGRVNLAGMVTASREVPVAAPDKPAQVVQQIAREVKALLAVEAADARCLGVGLALPGILEAESGRVVLAAAFPGLEKGAPLAERLAQALGGSSVVLGNVTNALLSAERLYGALRGVRDGVLAVLEPGQIGAAVLCDGRPLRGPFESSAELGHFKLEPDGPPCACGGRGCLETFIAWKHLRRQLADRGCAELAEAGPAAFWISTAPACAEVRGEALRRIGRALGSLANLTRPAALVLGGTLAEHAATVFEPLSVAVRRETLAPFAARMEIRPSTLGADAGPMGAASLVLQRVFTIPEFAAA